MSAWATPAFLRAAITRATDWELAARAAFAVAAWLTVPNAKEARFGMTFVDPVPRTVIPPVDVSAAALCAPDGWRTPANAAMATPAAASRTRRASFIGTLPSVVCDVIRRRP